MPQLAPVVLKDRDGNDHTFNPRNVSGGVATLVNSTGVPIGDKQVTASLTKTASGRYKAVFKIALPVLQDVVVGGVSSPQVVRTSYVEISFGYDGKSNSAERRDALGYAYSLLAGSFASDINDNLNAVY